MAKRSRPTGNKRQRERDKQLKREDKDTRRKWRKEMRARGFDPDAVDKEGDSIYQVGDFPSGPPGEVREPGAVETGVDEESR